ncbi:MULTISPECIES: hypothetical protein [Rhodococcus]|uniref:hypothetical protein n=1 Tax=Rhodococcus TaxID=1827 RepID=UPI0009D6A43D|nr:MULTISPECIES: hypothetical protein [Rhodococcus]MCZ4547856.1 hypothetical protein [Rhodococcus qingshengii]REK77990.1 hypothetical protein DVG80_32765 [Rhodococcus erythropolis]
MNTIRRLKPPSTELNEVIPHRSRVRALTVNLARVLAVLALVLVPLVAPGGPIASAGGFDCKDVPSPEFPNSVMAAEFDSSSKDREPKQSATGYETYGWAGLRWYTYDLGCGNDLVRAPDAVADTTLGNTFLAIGKGFAAAAFWLDDQTKTGSAAEEAGIAPAMVQFDQIVASISNGMLGVYGTWLGVALMVVATIIIWNALKSNAAAVTRTVAIAGAAMAIGALFVGAPQKAIQVADDTFGSVITDTQGQMLSVSGNTGDPRNVLIDKIFLDDWRKGWFGTNFNDKELQLGPKLRDTLAFSYAEQREVAGDNEAASKLAEEKAAKFDDEIIDKLDGLNLSYGQFQGKDSGRTGTGFMAMIKLAMPSILWIGASILKLTALLAIRLAILFAPIWVPIAAAHGGTLSRVCRMIATAYMWGVAGAVIIALYLMALVKLYDTDNGLVDGTWRLWFMVILTAVCWFIMRPFKRMTQTFTQNQAGALNRKARHAQTSMKQKFFKAGSAVVGGPAASMVEEGVGALRKATKRGGDLDKDSVTPVRPEGRELNQRRRHEVDKSRVDARKTMDRQQRLKDSRKNDVRRQSLAGTAKSSTGLKRPVADRPQTVGTAANRGQALARQLVGTEAGSPRSSSSVSETWDGGPRSSIAPMKVFTPPSRDVSTGSTTPSSGATRSNTSTPPRSTARLWTPSLTSAGTSPDSTDRFC